MAFPLLLLATILWRSIGPGGGGWIEALCVNPKDPETVYAGCDVGGFYLSHDGGRSWTPRNGGLRCYWVKDIAPLPDGTIILATLGGIYKSADEGRSWSRKGRGFPPIREFSFSAPICCLAVAPSRPSVVYAGVGAPRHGAKRYATGEVYFSEDGGESWEGRGGGIPKDAMVLDLSVHPRDWRVVLAATDRGLFLSRDGGRSFVGVGRGLPSGKVTSVAFCPSKPERVYACVESPPGEEPWHGGVWRSEDGGLSFRQASGGLPQRVGPKDGPPQLTSNYSWLSPHPKDPDVVYVGGTSWVSPGVYKTSDGGVSWEWASRHVESPSFGPKNMDYGWLHFWGPSVTALCISPSNPEVLYFGTSGHIFTTRDGGRTWRQCYTEEVSPGRWRGNGLETTCLFDIKAHPRRPGWLYLCYYDIGLIRSTDGGRTFFRSTGGLPHGLSGNFFTVAFDPEEPETLWAGIGQWGRNEGYVARSDDWGETWRVVGRPESGLPCGRTRAILLGPKGPKGRTLLVSVEGHGIYKSEDGGLHWSKAGEWPEGRSLSIQGLLRHPKRPQTLFAWATPDGEGRYGGIFVSEDGGRTWRALETRPPLPYVLDLAIHPQNPEVLLAACRRFYDHKLGREFPGGVYKSEDGGRTWRRTLDFHFACAVEFNPKNPDVAYASTTDHPYHDECVGEGVFRSKDCGESWSPENEGLTILNVTCLSLDPHDPRTIYLGTSGNGAFLGLDRAISP